ncbi:MAG: RNA methyltransferase [Hyphomicrobiales bacterium]
MSEPISRGGVYKEITSVSNPIIKEIRGLTQRKNRTASNQFLAEGMKLVASAVEADWPLRIFVFGKKISDHELVQKIAAKTKARGGMVLEVSEAVLSKIARRDNPQMVVGVFDQVWANESQIKPEGRDIWVALEGAKDPGNLGTIIRTADAAGAKGIILVGDTTDPFALEATRATMGSIFALPMVRFSSDEFTAWTKQWPGLIVGTHLEGAVDYRTVDYNTPSILFMGNEQSGLPGSLAECCTTLVKIPQAGSADSLNLAIATGVMLFEMQRDVLSF